MRGIGFRICGMARELISGLMAINMWVSGKTIIDRVKENSFGKMENIIKVSGRMIKEMGLEPKSMPIKIGMMDIGVMITKMVKDVFNGITVIFIRANGKITKYVVLDK